MRLNPAEIFQRWPEWLDLIFYPWYSHPEASAFEGRANTMMDVLGQLAPGGVSINGQGEEMELESHDSGLGTFVGEINEKMTLLSGTAMETLKSSYLSRLPIVLGGQFALASVASAGLLCEQELWATAEADISEIAIKAKEAFEGHMRGGGGGSAFGFFQAAGVVLGIASIFASGGASIAIGVASSAAGIATTYIFDEPAQPEPIPYSADSVQGIYSNIRDEVYKLADTVVSEQEDALRNGMDNASSLATKSDTVDDQGNVTEPGSIDNFYFGRPTDFLREENRHELFGGGQGIAVSKDALEYIAARLQFTAEHLTRALGTLDGVYGSDPWSRAGTIGIGPEGHYFAWSRLVDTLAESLDQCRKSLHALAGRMLYVARDFQGTEDAIAAELQRLVKDLPDPTPVGSAA